MSATVNKKQLIIFMALFAFILGMIFARWIQTPTPPKMMSATLLSTPRDVPTFNLIDDEEKPFTESQLQNHWTLLFFGFTDCPMVCPTTLATLNKTFKLVENMHHTNKLQMVMVTLDPARDTPEKLHHYVKAFHPNFIGAIASSSVLKELTEAWGIVYMAEKNEKTSQMEFNHSGTVLLFDPHGKLAGFFVPPLSAANMAADLNNLLSAG